MEKRFDLRYCEKFPNDSLLNGFAPRDLGTKPKCLPQQVQETVSWEQTLFENWIMLLLLGVHSDIRKWVEYA